MILRSTHEDSTLVLKCSFSVSYYGAQRYRSTNLRWKTTWRWWRFILLLHPKTDISNFKLSNFSHFYFSKLNICWYFIAKLKRFGGYGSALKIVCFSIIFHHVLYQNTIVVFHLTVKIKHHKVSPYLTFSHDYLAWNKEKLADNFSDWTTENWKTYNRPV